MHVANYHPEPLPIRSPAAAQAARIRARVRCSDPLARVLRELAFGMRPDEGFVAPVPTMGAH